VGYALIRKYFRWLGSNSPGVELFSNVLGTEFLARAATAPRQQWLPPELASKWGYVAVLSTDHAVLSVKAFEVVVKGDVGPSLVNALGGSHTFEFDHGETRLIIQVDGQASLYSLLASLAEANIQLVSLNPA
jgi:hypothetical protein